MSLLRRMARSVKKQPKRQTVLVECKKCRHPVSMQKAIRAVPMGDPGYIDVGIVCPFCQHFTHSHYDTPAIAEAREALAKATPEQRDEAKAEFRRVYDAEQARMKGGSMASKRYIQVYR